MGASGLQRGGIGAALAALAWLCAACQAPVAPDPPVLRFSAIPDQSPQRVRAQHEPLMAAVCERVGRRCAWVDAPSYDGLVDAMGRGEIDLAYFGAATFARANAAHAAVPLAMRDIDARFSSLVLVRRDDAAAGLQDLRGKRFSFGNASSTSGHLMLRERLRAAGIVPERDFAGVVYSDNHDATIAAVAEGRVVAGGVNASVYYARLVAGDAAAAALRVVWQSPPFVDYVWAARSALAPALRQQLTDALLDLRRSRPADRDALDAEGAAGYVPAQARDFDEMRRVLAAQRGP